MTLVTWIKYSRGHERDHLLQNSISCLNEDGCSGPIGFQCLSCASLKCSVPFYHVPCLCSCFLSSLLHCCILSSCKCRWQYLGFALQLWQLSFPVPFLLFSLSWCIFLKCWLRELRDKEGSCPYVYVQHKSNCRITSCLGDL